MPNREKRINIEGLTDEECSTILFALCMLVNEQRELLKNPNPLWAGMVTPGDRKKAQEKIERDAALTERIRLHMMKELEI